MPYRPPHDAAPPPNWPESVQYLTKPRLSPSLPPELIPLICSTSKFDPRPVTHPAHVVIKRITQAGHPANGQNGLFAKIKIGPGVLIIPYLGIIHATFSPDEQSSELPHTRKEGQHDESDYDLSLLRLSSSDPRNPFPGHHVSIGVDANISGNAGRMINDYRGVAGQANAEFRVGRGEGGEMRMELWSLKQGVSKGDEVLVSYGKGWWGARNGG